MKMVAVIEDDHALASSLRHLFESDGLNAVCFPDPPPLDELLLMHPDLIILDCILATTSGPDYLQALRKDPDLRNVPVIVTTGFDGLFDSLAELESSTVTVLHKPL